MNRRFLFSLAVMTGLLLSLLMTLPLLARAMPVAADGEVNQAEAAKISAGRELAPPPASPPQGPLLVPGNPTITPLSNTHTAPATTSVSITYDEAINPATVSTRTFAVHAAQTGRLTQTYSVSDGAISLTPPQPLKPGEVVQASATTGTLNLMGEGPISPTVWAFRAAASGGYAHFTDSGQTFPLSDTIAAALGDLDGDGDLDAVVANWIGHPNQVWLNDGSGLFTDSGQSLGTIGSLCIALGDLDGDGDLDAYIQNTDSIQPGDEIWFNDGAGVFTKSSQSVLSSSGGRLALGDLDGDGDPDAFLGGLDFGSGRANEVWLNDGTGVFADSGQRLGSLDTYDIALGDLDGDGDLDAFAANGTFGQDEPNQVWLNEGGGVFTDTYPSLGNARSTAVDLGDLDGDGDLDAFVTNYEGRPNEVWINNGSGVFTDSGQRLGDGDSWDVQLGDLDGDRDLDAFVTNANLYGDRAEANRVWSNDGHGVFTPTAQRLGLSASFGAALGDLDADGDLDAFVANADPDVYYTPEGDPNRVWLNTQPQLYFPLIMANWPPDFIVSSLRQLTACENVGKHHIFVRVVNADGEGLQDIPVRIYWGTTHPTDYAMPITNEAGWIEFAMFRGNYWVEVVAGSSELAGPVTPDIDRDEICDELGFPGNSLYHYSYEIFFTKVK